MARHVYYIPDCPVCGQEMVQRSTFNADWRIWWHCDRCGHDTPATNRGSFDVLTVALTTGLRVGEAETD